MQNEFKIEWGVEDGYIGKGRPQSLVVTAEEIGWEDEETIQDFLYELIQNDFLEKISWYVKNEEKFMAWAKEVTKSQGDKDA